MPRPSTVEVRGSLRFVKWCISSASTIVIVVIMFTAGALWRQSLYKVPSTDSVPRGAPETLFHKVAPGEGREEDALSEKLNALGYLSAYVKAPAARGITIYEPERAFEGLNLYTSGHAPEAYLMAMDGTLLHRWRYPLDQLWPGGEFAPKYFRRAHVFKNGDLLAIFEPVGIVKLDKDSKLLWSNRNRAHHDLSVGEDGAIYVLTQKVGPVFWFTDYGTVVEDFITELAPDGSLVREVSLLECFRDSRYGAYLKRAKRAGDVLHTNALKFLDGRHAERSPAFRRGNFLVSVRELDVVAVVDVDTKEVVWALSGMWFRQHESTLLENGNLLLFDNRGNNKKSKVVEVDPHTQEVVWVYGLAQDEPLDSSTCGVAARLPNGNTLITESNRGRAFEVTADKQIVWEYMSPHRAGDNDELIATLLDMVRLPATFSPEWLTGETPAAVSVSVEG